ncbi:MAG: alpha/beta hydrolase [Bacteroidota bacterium]
MKTAYIDYELCETVPVVFIHGFPFSHEMWKPQIEELKNLFRIVAYDVRGHGKSEVGDGRYTIEFFVNDLIELLNYRKIEKAVFVGLSMGGYIALRLAERFPERLKGLVLCDTRSEPDTNETRVKRSESILAVKKDGTAAFAKNFVKSVFAAETFEKKPEVVEFIRSIIEHNSPLGIAGTLLALASRTDTTPALATISVPTLILVGEYDTLTPISASEVMKQRIPNAELRVIPHAAHLSNLENPEFFNSALIEFLQRIV